MKSLFLFFSLWLMSGSICAINNYYVATTGSDANNGTSPSTPWATINHADAALSVGTAGTCTAGTSWISASSIGACVHVASGSYSGVIQTNKNGSSSTRIRYVSDTQYGARLTGGSSAVMWAVTGSYTDVVGFDFDGINGSTTAAVDGIVVYQTAPHSSVIRNRFHNIGNADPSVELHNAVVQSNSGGACTGCFGPGFSSYIGNFIYHNGGGAGHSVPGGGGQTGISLGNDDIAQDNIVVDLGQGWCMQATHSSTRNIITNNTFINCDRGGIRMADDAGGQGDSSTVTNNIIANNGNFGGDYGINMTDGSACGSHDVLSNNILYGNSPTNIHPCPSGPQYLNTFSGSNTATFQNYNGTNTGDYHLKTGSTGIKNGTTSCALSGCVPSVDFSGTTTSTPPDIGAYAFSGGAAPPSAPTGLSATVQ